MTKRTKKQIKKQTIKDFWCFYPFDGLTVDPTGKAQPCPCWSTHPGHTIADMKTSTQTAPQLFDSKHLASIREKMSKGERNESCEICYKKEEGGRRSQRQRKIYRYFINTPHPIKHEQLTDEFCKKYEPRLKAIELNFSNTCNLACAMCNRTHSSGWMQQEKLMPQTLKDRISPIYGKPWGTPHEPFQSYILNQRFIDSIIDNIQTYESIMIKGGEPLYDKRCIAFLDRISKLNPDVKLIIVTNATMIGPKMRSILNRFSNLELNLSIDGTGPIYEWIRGFSWERVNANIMQLMKMSSIKMLDINVTVSLYNIMHLNDIVSYFSRFEPKATKYLMSFNVVMEPWMNAYMTLPTFKKKWATSVYAEVGKWFVPENYLDGYQKLVHFDSFSNHEIPVSDYNQENTLGINKPDFDNIKNNLYNKPDQAVYTQQMIILACDYINWLNGIRKKRLQDYAPHIKLMMEQNGYK